MSCAGLTLGKIIFGYTPRVVLPPPKSTSAEFFVPAQTMIAVKLLTQKWIFRPLRICDI